MKSEDQQKQKQKTAAVSHKVSMTAAVEAEILKTAELALLMRVGQAEVLSMAKAGLLPHIKFGKGFLFLRSQVLATLSVMAEAEAEAAAAATAEAAAELARQV